MKLYEIAKTLSGGVIGDGEIEILGLSPINDITAGFIVYADGIDNLRLAEQSQAAAILVDQSVLTSSKPLVQVTKPIQAFIQLLTVFFPKKTINPSIHKTAVISENVQIGKNVSIGPFVIIESGSFIGDGCIIKGHVAIGHNVTIGQETTLHPNVTIYDDCKLGARVVIHSSSVIGSDGFGYSRIEGQHCKIPHVGHVVIGDDVEIGACTVVDRATLGVTKIGSGTKIDNFVQVAHSVNLGKHNILCAFTGVAGSSSTGDNVILAAGVGISDHVRIDEEVIVCARAGVPPKKHLRKGNIYLGNPARPRNKALEQEFAVTRIPYMRKKQQIIFDKLTSVETRLSQLEETTE